MIALDTHALLWWTLDVDRLSRRARSAIDGADVLGVPAIVFWETALLARKGRVKLGITVSEWMREVLSIARLQAWDLTPQIAVAAEALKMHPDPADRFIVATAIHYEVSLVTGDALIRRTKLVNTCW